MRVFSHASVIFQGRIEKAHNGRNLWPHSPLVFEHAVTKFVVYEALEH